MYTNIKTILIYTQNRPFAMLEYIECDPTGQGTLRPNKPSIHKASRSFQPMKVDDRPTHITLPDGVTPLNPYTLFELYFPEEIIDSIINATNAYN